MKINYFYNIILICILSICLNATYCSNDDMFEKMITLNSLKNSKIPKAVSEEFNFEWNGRYSPDGLWSRASWVATGNNLFTWNNEVIQSPYNDASGGVLLLTVRAGKLEGGEIQTVRGDLGYGYYEVRMKPTGVSGCCVSFFWKEINYGPGEIDIEFLTNESWTSTSGSVHYTVHPGWDVYHTAKKQTFSFNPSEAFHRYGFLWTPDKISYTIDGQVVQTYARPACENIPNTRGYIMMNAWTGSPNWGGGPPTQDATSIYDWVKYYPYVKNIPEDSSNSEILDFIPVVK